MNQQLIVLKREYRSYLRAYKEKKRQYRALKNADGQDRESLKNDLRADSAQKKAKLKIYKDAKSALAADLTVGKPLKKISLFTLPLLLGNIIQQLYAMADAFIVGQTISNAALGAVGATGAISFLVIGFCQGLAGGFAVVTAQFFGAKNEENVKRSVACSLVLCIFISIFVTIVSVLCTTPLLKIMNTPADIFQDAHDYIIVIFYGVFASVFYNMLSNQLRAIGDARTPLYFLIFASVLNVVLDVVFITVFKTGVAGAGWATVISQTLSAALCLVYMFWRYPILRLKKRHFKFGAKFAWLHLRLGLPMALQFSITAVGVMVLQAALNGFGTLTVYAYTAANKLDTLAMQVTLSLGSAMATFVGQNYGAGNYERIKQGVKQAAILAVVLSALTTLITIALCKPVTVLFLGGGEEEAYAISFLYTLCNASFYIFLGLLFVYRNALQGMGRGALTMVGGLLELILRSLVALVAAHYLNFIGVALSNMAAWASAAIFLMIAYYVIVSPKRKNALRRGTF